jgi:hypothetical protein
MPDNEDEVKQGTSIKSCWQQHTLCENKIKQISWLVLKHEGAKNVQAVREFNFLAISTTPRF